MGSPHHAGLSVYSGVAVPSLYKDRRVRRLNPQSPHFVRRLCAPDEVPQELLAVKSLLRYNTPVNIPCKGHKYAGNKVSSAIAGQTSPPKARGGYQRRAPPPPHPYG